MPIYEYKCQHCQHAFELIQKVTDTVATHCPQCEQETVIRLVSAPGFQLKGTGWYVTDFKNNHKKSVEGSGGASASASASAKSTGSAEATAVSTTNTESLPQKKVDSVEK